MNYEVKGMFAWPVYYTVLDTRVFPEFVPTWTDNTLNHISEENTVLDLPEFAELRSEIQAHVDHFHWTVLQRTQGSKSYITKSWMNLTKAGEQHHQHWHVNSLYSGTVYNCDSDGALVFHSPWQSLLSIDVESHNEYNSTSMMVYPQPGLLVLWPSQLQHSVNPPSQSRTSLSFNTWIQGSVSQGWDSELILDPQQGDQQ